jgi:hypothetical protein
MRDIGEMPSGVPSIMSIYATLNWQLRGCVFVQAFFAALYRMEVIHIVYRLSAFIMFLNIVTFRLFLKKAPNLWIALPIIAILPFNTFYQRMVFFPFTGQLFSFGAMTLSFYLEYYLSERKKFDPMACLALVFVLTVCGLVWIEGMLYPILPAVAFVFALILNKNYDRKSCVLNAAFAGCTWVVINFRLLAMFLNLFLFLDENPQAFPMHLATFMDVSGLWELSKSANAALLLSLLSNAIVSLVVLFQLKKEKFSSFISASFILFALLQVFFCARYFEEGEKFSYYPFKSALTLSFIALIFIFRFMEDRLSYLALAIGKTGENRGPGERFSFSGFRARSAFAAAALFAAFFVLNIAAWLRNASVIASMNTAVISTQCEAIRMFSENGKYAESDFIVNFDQLMPAYIAEYYSPLGRTYWVRGSGARKNFRNSFKKGDIYIADSTFEEVARTTDADVVLDNDVCKIYSLGENSLLLCYYPGMAGEQEVVQVGGEYMALRRLKERRSGLRFVSMADREADFTLSFYDGSPDGNAACRLYVNGTFAGEAAARGGFMEAVLAGVAMKPGMNDVDIEFDRDVSDISLTGVSFR